MTELKFRKLRADEIECRVGHISANKGLSLLLYKDARCDMNVLDETVGPLNWKREHTRDNRNCVVSIWDSEKKEWISKEDTGTESNTESEKGLASDSFKRACVNWGIGRELYSAPFIWIPADRCNLVLGTNGKPRCNDKFIVTKIAYSESGDIEAVEITNQTTGQKVFPSGAASPKAQSTTATDKQVNYLRTLLREAGKTPAEIAQICAQAKKATGSQVSAWIEKLKQGKEN